MGSRRSRASSVKRRASRSTRVSRRDADAGVVAALGEVQRVLDTPLPQLMESDEQRAAAQQLARDAQAVPAMVRLAGLVAFVGSGRPATQAGNLRASDAVAAAIRLRTRDDVSGAACSMDDLPEVAHAFRWAIAAELLAARATKIVAGPRAQDLERDRLSGCLGARSRCSITACSTGSGGDGARATWSYSTTACVRYWRRSSRQVVKPR